MAGTELNAVVTQKIEHAPGLMTLRVVPDGWEMNDFTPGQFIAVGLPGAAPRCAASDPEEEAPDPERIIKRPYSIASASIERAHLDFYISLVRSGQLTPRLFNLGIGDRLWLGPRVTGFFTLESVPEGMNIVMLATGTGLAPYMSMLRSELTQGHPGRFCVVHGARHSWDLGYHGELLMLSRMSPNFAYIPVVSNPEEEPVPWSGHTGFIQELWRSDVIEKAWGRRPMPDDTHVFLCGHPLMIETMEEIIKAEGFQEHKRKNPGTYHLERY